MLRNFKILFFISLVFLCSSKLNAKEDSATVAIYGLRGGSPIIDAMTYETLKSIRRQFEALGRFIPVSESNLLNLIEKNRNLSDSEIFSKVSRSLNADIYIVVTLREAGTISFGYMDIYVLNDTFKFMRQRLKVKSKIIKNIPLLLQREVILLHKNLPLSAKINKYNNNFYRINCGQWHGLKNNKKYYTDDGNKIIIKQVSRFESYVTFDNKIDTNNTDIEIKIYPDVDKQLNKIENFIEYNLSLRYGIGNTKLRGVSPGGRLLNGLLVVNMGGNILLPGYGAYLSTHYMGFTNPRPAPYTTALAGTTYCAEILAIPVMTKFKGNFLPWIHDGDKDDHAYRLQQYLWIAVPFTFAASYMDQLAFQYKKDSVLPPFWYSKDSAAAAFSLVIPGGGLFYKGYRKTGWIYFYSNFFLMGYIAYEDKWKSKTFVSAAVILKLAEVIHAYFITPDYNFYNDEKQRVKTTKINFSMHPGIITDDMIYSLSVDYKF